mmetsp:Transcript_10692/g.22417  ORF Transcript_10692/g.22417 Transcript_10692/m.22417 type:complete len:289 (-) Transcript_10692:1000-1866(-)
MVQTSPSYRARTQLSLPPPSIIILLCHAHLEQFNCIAIKQRYGTLVPEEYYTPKEGCEPKGRVLIRLVLAYDDGMGDGEKSHHGHVLEDLKDLHLVHDPVLSGAHLVNHGDQVLKQARHRLQRQRRLEIAEPLLRRDEVIPRDAAAPRVDGRRRTALGVALGVVVVRVILEPALAELGLLTPIDRIAGFVNLGGGDDVLVLKFVLTRVLIGVILDSVLIAVDAVALADGLREREGREASEGVLAPDDGIHQVLIAGELVLDDIVEDLKEEGDVAVGILARVKELGGGE